MDNYLLLQKNPELQHLSEQLGFTKTLFLDEDFVLLTTPNQKELLRMAEQARAKQKIVIYRPSSEELLRFALEKTTVHGVLGLEQIHPKDSVHHVRGGLDQVLCTIAAERGKIIFFSFVDVLHAKNLPQMLARMKFNVRLCRKYHVKAVLSTFASGAEEMRSAKDLEALWRVMGGVA